MTLDEIAGFISLMQAKGLAELTVSLGGSVLTLRGATAAADSAEPPSGPMASTAIRAPAAGIFRASHPARAEPLGERAICRGAIVAFLQVGPCLRPVTACADGWIGTPLVSDGAMVGFGQALVSFDATAMQAGPRT